MASLSLQVRKVDSFPDPTDGKLGKIIELVEVRPFLRSPIRSGGNGEIGKIVHEAMQAMQVVQVVIPQIGVQKSFTMPKIVLFLTEEESESLGVKFEVNRSYRVTFNGQKIEFKQE